MLSGSYAHAKRASRPRSSIRDVFGDDREAFERALDAELSAHQIELVCLAGFMRLFTPWFVTRWNGRMLNIHPALLPQFKGLHTHRRALKAEVKRHGATVHFVSLEMDSGQIILQDSVPVHDGDTEETLAGRVLDSRAPHLSRSLTPRGRRPRQIHKIKPPGARLGATRSGSPRHCSCNFQIFRRGPAAVGDKFVFDLLAFIERAQAGALYGGDVNEHILVAAPTA